MNGDESQIEVLSEKTLRQIFKEWDRLQVLGRHPLVSWRLVIARRRAAGYTDGETGRGLALRETVQSALDMLRPDGPPEPREKRWRPYVILTEQYLHGRRPDWVMEQLCVSKATYFEEQKRALEMLVAILEQREQAAGPLLAPPVPFMAPPRAAQALVGRDGLLHDLKRRLLGDPREAIVALEGLPGVGKTALAIELAYDPEIRERFRDGVLWAGLGRRPDVMALLGNWAAAAGAPAEAIAAQAGLAERAAVVRAAIGQRHMLLVIDDAWGAEAALALRVGGPNCAHLVTTRQAGVALDFDAAGDHAVVVRELGEEDGLQLLARLSPRAVEADPDEARSLVRSVGGLPLALILMGRYLYKQSHHGQTRRLHEALATLRAAETRLQLGQPHSPLEPRADLPPDTPLSLQAVIGLSDDALDDTAHRALINLSLFEPKPNTFSEEVALAALAVPAAVLDGLVDCGLVESVAPDRYTLHQTIADYAALQGPKQTADFALPGPEPAAAERVVRFYAGYAVTYAGDFARLEPELGNFLMALDAAFQAGLYEPLIRMIDALFKFLEMRGLYGVGDEHLRRAYAAAQSMEDQAAQAALLYALGDLHVRRGQFLEAPAFLRQSIDLARATHAREIEANALFQLGLVNSYIGDLLPGRELLEQSLQIDRETGSREAEAFALNALGFIYEEMSEYARARAYLEEALRIARDCGDVRGEGWAHYNFLTVELPLGDIAAAQAHAEQCLQCYRRLGDRRGEGWLILMLGRIARQQGRHDAAMVYSEQSRQMQSNLGDRMGHGYALHNIGVLHADLGDAAAAAGYFEQALQVFDSIGCRTGRSQCRNNLGIVLRRCGDDAGARPLFEEARDLMHLGYYRRGESAVCANLGMIHYRLGDERTALEYAREAVSIVRPLGARSNLARALTALGHVLAGTGRRSEAEDAYREALALYRSVAQRHRLADPLAGLAGVLMSQGDPDGARALAEEIFDYLQAAPALPGADRPGDVYLACYQVLAAAGDPRAPTVLYSARAMLQDRAARIEDVDLRRKFWENVPAHVEIMRIAATPPVQ